MKAHIRHRINQALARQLAPSFRPQQVELSISKKVFEIAKLTATAEQYFFGWRLTPNRVLREWLLNGYEHYMSNGTQPITPQLTRLAYNTRLRILLKVPYQVMTDCLKISAETFLEGSKHPTKPNQIFRYWIQTGSTMDPDLAFARRRHAAQVKQDVQRKQIDNVTDEVWIK